MMSSAILPPNIGHAQKNTAYTCGWLTRFVISGQAKERRKKKKKDRKDEDKGSRNVHE